ncbi:MAG: chorismate synthase [Candidatus Krumholzibacteriota bacterium]
MSSTFGRLFRVTTFGESHGGGVGVVVDGCPPGLALTTADVQGQLDRRRPGQGPLTTDRKESDTVEFLSGIEKGLTLGSPLALLTRNRDIKPEDYSSLDDIPRPSHADFTTQAKYGIRSSSGGGRASARETWARVAAGAVAEKWLAAEFGVMIVAWVDSVGEEGPAGVDPGSVTRDMVDATAIRCPDQPLAKAMEKVVKAARKDRDSVGGVVSCVCRGVPAGWGEPVFDKMEALLAQGMLSIPAAKGFEIGSGFGGARQRGSVHNDPFVQKQEGLGTLTNNSGGVQGGITNGEPIVFRVAFKPPATIGIAQQTADFSGSETTLEARGRHDPCVVPRAVPIVEAMTALVLADLALIQRARG